MGTVSVPKSARAPFRSSSSAGFAPGRDLQCPEHSEALGFRSKPSKSTRKWLEGVGVNFRPSDSVQRPGFCVFIFLSASLTELRIQMQGI